MLPVAVVLALASGDAATSADPDAGRPTSTPPIPTAELRTDLEARRASTPEILYINFDGGVLQSGCGNDPRHDCSTLADTFNGYVGPFEGDLGQRVNILTQARKDLADFGVQVVIERPPPDVSYTMVMYGDLGPQSFAGIAPYIDCEDRRGGDLSFTQGFATSNTGSTVILQEAAHTWGLEHVDAPGDILNPFKSSGLNQSFHDECYKIVANADLQPTSGSCNQVHTLFCDVGYQNSWREMMHLFGPHVPDTAPPSITITSPEDESVHVLPITIPLLGEITDNLHPQFYRLQLFATCTSENPLCKNDPAEADLDEHNAELNLLINNPEPGDYELRIVITDEGGNPAEDVVRFTILPEGSEVPVEEDFEDDMVGDGRGCRAAHPGPTGWALGLLALAAIVVRRRRGARC
jgi:MYXO-CTERM domain-containing protein